jgi:hypothetical protein
MMRERILAMGGPGSGKTFSWLKLASHFKNATFYVIDSEIGAERSLKEFPQLTNVRVFPVVEWMEYRKAQKEIVEKCIEKDWVVIDMADKAWTAVQKHYIDEIFDKEMGEYFLEARKKIKKDAKSLFAGRDAALKGWTDWPVVNRLYEDFINPLVYRIPAHLYMATAGQAVSEDDAEDIRDLYGPHGIRPSGQKNLAYQPDTVLLLAHRRDGYYMTTVKDRGGRRYFDRQKLINFPVQYGKVAGWL